MGWGTNFTAELYLSRKMFQDRDDVVSSIEDDERIIARTKAELTALAFANPKDITPGDETPIYYVQSLIEENIETLEEFIISKYMKELLLRNWETKNDDVP